jgi:hypothetical protein
MDEPVKLDLDPELALRALLKVDPDAPVAQDQPDKDQVPKSEVDEKREKS